MKHTLTITNWTPIRLNLWEGRHWRVKHRLKKMQAEVLGTYSALASIPAAEGKRRVSLILTMAPRQRRPDPDAFWKGMLDGLVLCGLLVDDGPKWCELGSVSYERGPVRQTRIVLEDV